MIKATFFFTMKKCIENIVITQATMPILMTTLRSLPEVIVFDLVTAKIECGEFYEAELEPCFSSNIFGGEEFSHLSIKRIRIVNSSTWRTIVNN